MTKFLLRISDQGIQFTHLGETIDPIFVLENAAFSGCSIKRVSDKAPIKTRSKSLGAVEDGIDTIVGIEETNIRFFLEVHNEGNYLINPSEED